MAALRDVLELTEEHDLSGGFSIVGHFLIYKGLWYIFGSNVAPMRGDIVRIYNPKTRSFIGEGHPGVLGTRISYEIVLFYLPQRGGILEWNLETNEKTPAQYYLYGDWFSRTLRNCDGAIVLKPEPLQMSDFSYNKDYLAIRITSKMPCCNDCSTLVYRREGPSFLVPIQSLDKHWEIRGDYLIYYRSKGLILRSVKDSNFRLAIENFSWLRSLFSKGSFLIFNNAKELMFYHLETHEKKCYPFAYYAMEIDEDHGLLVVHQDCKFRCFAYL